MKLIEMRCPNCDAPLSVDSNRGEAFCAHCNTAFLIEGAPKAEPRDGQGAVEGSASRRAEPEGAPAKATVEFERAKPEPPVTERFAGSIAAALRSARDARSARKKTKAKAKAADAQVAASSSDMPQGGSSKRVEAIAAVVTVVILVAVLVAAGTCGTGGSREGGSSDARTAPASAPSASAAKTSSSSPSAASSSAPSADAQSSPEAASSTSGATPAAKDGFPCNLDGAATFSGVTIPVDSTWKDSSPAWDWRHETFSYTAASSTMEDVQVSISTFTGDDTRDAAAFMEDYADFAPIYLHSGKYKVNGRETRDGVTYTRIEGVDGSYENLFEINPVSRHESIRESHANKVVRCYCLVGYAENGTGFAVAVRLEGSADNGACQYSANKILDGVTFDPSQCDVDSDDLWLYEVQH